jgi:hypothetical protein
MIAAFLTEPNTLHVAYLVALKGFKVKAHGYCGAVANAADGSYQVPDWAFDGRRVFQLAQGTMQMAPCDRCSTLMKALREPPR